MEQTRPVRPEPVWLRVAWIALAVVAAVLAVHGTTRFGDDRTHEFLANWLSDLAVWVGALLSSWGRPGPSAAVAPGS